MTKDEAKKRLDQFNQLATTWDADRIFTHCAWCGHKFFPWMRIITYGNGLSAHYHCSQDHDNAVADAQFGSNS